MWRLLDWVRGHRRIEIAGREFVIRRLPKPWMIELREHIRRGWSPDNAYTRAKFLKPVHAALFEAVIKPRLSPDGWVLRDGDTVGELTVHVLNYSIADGGRNVAV